ncbi:RNase H domain-containing protein [Trichonephila clavipes]|nr:RNase H domain-containing protein [Trichonephila clavipes]
MFDPSSFANPTPLAHAEASRDVLPRGGTSQAIKPLRSELIAIRRGLQFVCETDVQFQDVWILTDSHASELYLTNWTCIGDMTSLNILNLLDRISSNHRVHFQSVPSHVGINGKEKVDFLARTAAEEGMSPAGPLTFSELSSLKKIELNQIGKTPPSHPWYFGRNLRVHSGFCLGSTRQHSFAL